MRDPVVWATVLVCVVVALLQVAAHWFPWRVVPGAADAAGRLRRVWAYVYGTVTILLGMALWAGLWSLAGRGPCSPWVVVGGLALVIAAAGLGTLATYAVDAAAEARAVAMDYEELAERLEL